MGGLRGLVRARRGLDDTEMLFFFFFFSLLCLGAGGTGKRVKENPADDAAGRAGAAPSEKKKSPASLPTPFSLRCGCRMPLDETVRVS